MTHRGWGACLAALLLVGIGTVPTHAQHPGLPSQSAPSVRPVASVPVERLPGVDAAALRRADRASSTGPYRYGRTQSIHLRPSQHGTWEQLPSGRWLWRLRIQSPDAVSMSLGLSTVDLPPGASLYVHGAGDTVVRGPYTAADVTEGELWTPLVRTEELIVELDVPTGSRRAVHLTVGRVVHGYRPLPTRGGTTGQSQSGSCNLDVACSEADPWRRQVRAVGGYTLRRGQDHLFCSGTLVNSTAQDPRPLFLTAEHCVQTPEQAASMVFYWNFQTAQCRQPGIPRNGTFPDDSLALGVWDQTSTGALLRARYGSVHEDGTIGGKPDLTLVEIDDTVPARYNLYLSGWDRSDAATSQGVTIHHPSGHGKRISFDRDPTRITGWGRPSDGDTHLRVGDWEVGTTERGSSGGPLFDSDGAVVGVLSGGSARCDGDGDVDDNDRPDWYGRLAAGFDKGDYQNRTLNRWLDPAGTGATAIDGERLVQDARPPARPANFRVASVSPTSVTLKWTAPGDDGTTGTADKYLLRRRANTPIQTQAQFDRARPVSMAPAPAPAGTPQSVTVPVNPDTSHYFALAATDEVLNTSPFAATTQDATPVAALRVLTPPTPNPARQLSSLEFVVRKPQTVHVDLYDTVGRHLRAVPISNDPVLPFRRQRITVDVSSLASGMYFLRIQGTSASRTARVVVTK